MYRKPRRQEEQDGGSSGSPTPTTHLDLVWRAGVPGQKSPTTATTASMMRRGLTQGSAEEETPQANLSNMDGVSSSSPMTITRLDLVSEEEEEESGREEKNDDGDEQKLLSSLDAALSPPLSDFSPPTWSGPTPEDELLQLALYESAQEARRQKQREMLKAPRGGGGTRIIVNSDDDFLMPQSSGARKSSLRSSLPRTQTLQKAPATRPKPHGAAEQDSEWIDQPLTPFAYQPRRTVVPALSSSFRRSYPRPQHEGLSEMELLQMALYTSELEEEERRKQTQRDPNRRSPESDEKLARRLQEQLNLSEDERLALYLQQEVVSPGFASPSSISNRTNRNYLFRPPASPFIQQVRPSIIFPQISHMNSRSPGRVTASGGGIDPDRMSYEELLELEERLGEVKKKGASKDTIAAHTQTYTFHSSSSSNKEALRCSVCMDDFEDRDEVRLLPCFHAYHRACIDQWLTKKASCPVCQRPIGQAQ